MKKFKQKKKVEWNTCTCSVCGKSHKFAQGMKFKYADTWYNFCGKDACTQVYQICSMYIVKPDDALDLLERKQQKICECCRRVVKTDNPTYDLVIEHCHRTHLVRGITCKSCNQIIGKLESDTYKNHNVISARPHHYDWIALTADLEMPQAVASHLEYQQSRKMPKTTIDQQQQDDDDFWIEFSKPYTPPEPKRKRSDLTAEDILANIYKKKDK